MPQKIKDLKEIQSIIQKEKTAGKKIVQCHGVFDLLHPGHIRHFREAKKQGDVLIVTVTPDKFVNKGPGRPVFHEQLRMECLAALHYVDYVVLNDSPDAISCLDRIQPNIYVKGKEYKQPEKDVTGKISLETQAVQKHKGKIHYTDDIVFSSSSILNRFFDPLPLELQKLIKGVKEKYSCDELLQKIEDLSKLKVLVIGDAIVDEYQYVNPLGQSGKGLHMVAENKERDLFLGGSLIVAEHLAQFCHQVHLITALGNDCPNASFIGKTLHTKITPQFFRSSKPLTLTKKRYVLKDGKNLSKLFETYSSNTSILTEQETDKVVEYLQRYAADYDLVLVCDFGNGFTNPSLVDAISDLKNFLAINTQSNSGNRGFNVITHYKRADYISLNEPEARFAAHDRYSPIDKISKKLSQNMNAKAISVTRGVNGVLCYGKKDELHYVPALHTQSIDRVGAGDSYFALSSLCVANGYELILSALMGSIAAGLDVQIIGNKEPVRKSDFLKFLIRLVK